MSIDHISTLSDTASEQDISDVLTQADPNKSLLFVGKQSIGLSRQFEQCGMFPDQHLINFPDPQAVAHWLGKVGKDAVPFAIICDVSYPEEQMSALKTGFLRRELIPMVLYDSHNVAAHHTKTLAMLSVAEDFLYESLGLSTIKERIVFLSELKKIEKIEGFGQIKGPAPSKFHLAKRAFDIIVSGMIIMLISPILILIAIAIKLESRGSVFFISKRAGEGYQIFDFYKFRTMRSDADQMRDHLKTLNTYYAKERTTEKTEPFFFKVKNDPRVTRVGRILRKTSLDELPQLFNVLKGDMSLVGNRPLPLDEGATLTVDRWADRFLAPAGMTGLWQISSNKDDMSVAERIELDLDYVKHSSFSLDMKILLKTIPAMMQRD